MLIVSLRPTGRAPSRGAGPWHPILEPVGVAGACFLAAAVGQLMAPVPLPVLVLEGVLLAAELGTTRCEPRSLEALADHDRLARVLAELVENALEAQGHAGEICLEARAAGGEDVVEVRDAGPGIPPELGERIFEPLFSTRAKGVGLGLVRCRQILELHGGKLELAPTAGPGACFRIRLPSSRRPLPTTASPGELEPTTLLIRRIHEGN